jgi:hypothetical protein
MVGPQSFSAGHRVGGIQGTSTEFIEGYNYILVFLHSYPLEMPVIYLLPPTS